MSKLIGAIVIVIGLLVLVGSAAKLSLFSFVNQSEIGSTLVSLAGLIVAFVGLNIFMRKPNPNR